ncbi:multidrug efflux SMR transporter [uncultured Capnocytophaga sp.]|jgi:small multidrug resistance protein|uniref:DMT family transporter n=1 Tax=uncultured Capnocytophaga sp. TaxID=159273 RepID=UPI002625499A|nr:multidrug efflux SMR transporter [uncultured Capnocytophaga sp.]
MAWIFLVLAGLFEVLFVFSMGKARETVGRQSFLWYALFAIALSLSMWLMMKATKTLPLGTAYAVWTGIGAAGSVVMGMIFFKEPVTLWRVVFLVTLISSIIGLKLTN